MIATTGDPARRSLPVDPLPGNTRVVPYVRFDRLLPHVDVMITNGGFGGTQAALAHGVQLVAAGVTQDKREINARIDWAGAGANLHTQRPSPEQVRDGARRVLAEPSYRQRAQQLADEYRRYDAPVRAADPAGADGLPAGVHGPVRTVTAPRSERSAHRPWTASQTRPRRRPAR